MILVSEAGGLTLTTEGMPYELGNPRIFFTTPALAQEIVQLSAELDK